MDGNTAWVVIILSLTAILCVLIPFIMPWLRKKRIERKCVERPNVLHVPDPRKLIRSYSFFFGGKLLDLLNEKPDLTYIEIDVYSDEVLVYENHNRSSGESFEFIRYRIPFSGFDKTEITDATTGNSGFVFLSLASFSEIYRAFGVEGYYHSETPVSVRRDGPGTEVVFCIEPDKGETRKEFFAKIEAVKRTVDQAAKPFRDATKHEFDEKNKAADDAHNRLSEAEKKLFGTAHSASDNALNQGNLALSKKAYDDYSLIVHDAFKLSHEQRKAELIETYKLLFAAAATELQVFFDAEELMANTLMWLICSLGAGNLSSEEKTEIAKKLCFIHEIDDSSAEQLLSQVDDDSSWETVRDMFKLCASFVRDYDDEAFFQHYRRKTNKKKLSELYVQIYVLLRAVAESSEEEALEDVAYILNDDPVPSEDEAQDDPEGSDEDDSREVTTIEVENFPYGDSGPKEYEPSVDLIGDLIGELLGKPWNLPDGDLPFPVRHLDAEEVDSTRIKVKWEANGREFWLIHEKPRSTCVAEDVRDLVANCLDAIETFFEDEKTDQEEDDDQEDDGKNSFLDALDEESDEDNYHIEVPLFAIEPEECASMDDIEISLEEEWNKGLRWVKRGIPVNYLGVEETDETHVEIKMEIDGDEHVFLVQKPSNATVFGTDFLQRCVGDFLDELDNEDADNDIHDEGSNETDTTKEEKDGKGGLNEEQRVENQATPEKNGNPDIADDVVYDLSWEPVEGLEDFTYRFVVIDGIKGLEITGYLNYDYLGHGSELVIKDYYGGYPVLSIAHLQGDYERLILPTTLRFVRDFHAVGKNSKVYKGVPYVGTHDNPYLIAVVQTGVRIETTEIIMHPDCEFAFIWSRLSSDFITRIVASDKLKNFYIDSVCREDILNPKSVLRSGLKKYKNGFYISSPNNPYCLLLSCQQSGSYYELNVHPDCRVVFADRTYESPFKKIYSLTGMKSVISLSLEMGSSPVRIDSFPRTLMYIEGLLLETESSELSIPKSVFYVRHLSFRGSAVSNSKIILNDNARYETIGWDVSGQDIEQYCKPFIRDRKSLYIRSYHNKRFCLLRAGCFNDSMVYETFVIPSETVVLAERCFCSPKEIKRLTIPRNVRDFEDFLYRTCPIETLRFENQFDVSNLSMRSLDSEDGSPAKIKNLLFPDCLKIICGGGVPNSLDSFVIPSSCRTRIPWLLYEHHIKKLIVNNENHLDLGDEIFYEYALVKDGLGKPSGSVELSEDIIAPGYTCFKNLTPEPQPVEKRKTAPKPRNPIGFSNQKLAKNLAFFNDEQISAAKSYDIVKLAIKMTKNITDSFGETDYWKSRAVCTKGFESANLSNGTFAADYSGSYGTYHISLSVKNGKLVGKCDCPFGARGDKIHEIGCKHIVGALLYLDALSRGFKK